MRDAALATPAPLANDAIVSARAAGLRYVSDAHPGIRRRRAGGGMRYVDAEGAVIRDEAELRRIKALAIPPAWTDVWICPSPDGHLQATGRDARGRKQYRYHRRWAATRDETKYDRMIAFGEVLPKIRVRIDADLRLPGLPRDKVIATVVRLLELTHARVGNEEYARANGSFGLTTLRTRHVAIGKARLAFRFRGKGGKEHNLEIKEPRLARIIRHCHDLPGYDLFQYVDETGERRSIGSTDVNDYLKEVSGQEFTAKDFRTWAGTLFAACALTEAETETGDRRGTLNRTIERVAERLGNTPAVCRKCYIHPAVIDGFLNGTLPPKLRTLPASSRARPHRALIREEAMLLRFLRRSAAPTPRRRGAMPRRRGPAALRAGRRRDQPSPKVAATGA